MLWVLCSVVVVFFFFFKQKTAYELRISDWSSDVCSSDLLVSSRPFVELREIARRFARKLPNPLHKAAKKTDEFARGMAMGGTLFEELGFYYVGPIDGHNLDHLIPVLENVRDSEHGPVLIHAEIGRASCREKGRPEV